MADMAAEQRNLLKLLVERLQSAGIAYMVGAGDPLHDRSVRGVGTSADVHHRRDSKLEWAKLSGSDRQMDDAAAVVAVNGKELDWDYLTHWAADLQLQEQVDLLRGRQAWVEVDQTA